MKSTIYGIALILASSATFSIMIFHHTGKTSAKTAASLPHSDEISGEWDARLEAFGTITDVKMTLDRDENKITGTAESGHTGAGTISEGVFENNKLSFIVNFAKHESVSFNAELKDGKLAGEYATEGRVSKWEATKKISAASKTDVSKNPASSDAISGEWNASLIANDTNAPLTLKLNLDSGKVSGTFESAHLGAGTVEDGSLVDNKISFTLKTAQATITFNGVLKDGKLAGEFSAGKMNGKWEAQKK